MAPGPGADPGGLGDRDFVESRAGNRLPLGCIPPHPDPVTFGNTSLVSWSPEQAASSADRLGPAADPWPPSPLQKGLSQWGGRGAWARRGRTGK